MEQKQNGEPMIRDVLDAIGEFSGQVDRRFEHLEKEIVGVKSDIGTIKATMVTLVTKSYLDDKLADLEGHLIATLRKEDAKVERLIEFLAEEKVLKPHHLDSLRDFAVFPRLQ